MTLLLNASVAWELARVVPHLSANPQVVSLMDGAHSPKVGAPWQF